MYVKFHNFVLLFTVSLVSLGFLAVARSLVESLGLIATVVLLLEMSGSPTVRFSVFVFSFTLLTASLKR